MFPVDAVLLLALGAGPGTPQMPCICPPGPICISLVGSYGGAPALAFGQFSFVVLDTHGVPIAGAAVVVDISNALDLAICSDQLDANASVDCANGRVTKIAGADGSVTFTILGHSNGAGNASCLLGGGRIFANGTLIQSPTVSAFDLDGASGMGAGDLSAWLTDFGSGQPFGRSDYDCSGTLGAGDLSLWLTAFGTGTMAESCGASCP